MTCSCHKQHDAKLDFAKRPEEPCVYCAEKHIATAAALARENGYETTNRNMMLGELVLAQWHLWNLPGHRELAESIRDIRHEIQEGRTPDLLSVAAKVTEAAAKTKEK